MPTITFTVSASLATKLQTIALADGFANAKDWMKNMVRQALIADALKTSQPQASSILATAEAAAKVEANTIA